MTTQCEGGNKEFLAFLTEAPSLDEASSGATTELTGLVSRVAEGRFAITIDDGRTYELDAAAVQRFRVVGTSGVTPVVAIRIVSDVLKDAALRPIKPLIKDVIKDPIKDIIHDGTLHAKDLRTDPIVDKNPPKDLHTDPLADTPAAKDIHTDPALDKPLFKDLRKDPLQDPVKPGIADVAGTGAADPLGGFDPTGQVVSPAAAAGFGGVAGLQQATMMPFVMATPHHGPQHLLQLQAGVPQAAALGGVQQQLKPFAYDTIKELAWGETIKEPVFDTRKELIVDTRKELVWDTWIEGGPYTVAEGIFDPGQVVTQPAGFGMPGFM